MLWLGIVNTNNSNYNNSIINHWSTININNNHLIISKKCCYNNNLIKKERKK